MALGSGQTQPGNSKLYLYSFISTLLVILLLSLLFSLRLVLRRRKLRLLLDDARREGWGRERVLEMANARGVRLGSDLSGVLDAHGPGGATTGGRRDKKEVKLGKLPELFEVQLDDEKARKNVEEWQPLFLSHPSPASLPRPVQPFFSTSPLPTGPTLAAQLETLDNAVGKGPTSLTVGLLILLPEEPSVMSAREDRKRRRLLSSSAVDGDGEKEEEEWLVDVDLGWETIEVVA